MTVVWDRNRVKSARNTVKKVREITVNARTTIRGVGVIAAKSRGALVSQMIFSSGGSSDI
jgi:hypothetical protein